MGVNLTLIKKEVADKMNLHFCLLGENLAKNIPVPGVPAEQCIYKWASTQFAFTPVTEEQVYQSLARFLSLLAHTSRKLNVILINQSFDTGIFPDDWKKAKVSPVYKADARNIADNYRPISIFPTISKLIERIVHAQVLEFFTKNNLLSKFQSGFRGMHSACTALLFATDVSLRNMNEGLLTGNVFIDFKKAFDTVDNSTLLRKLCYYGIQGKSLSLFESYLANRRQQRYMLMVFCLMRDISIVVFHRDQY